MSSAVSATVAVVLQNNAHMLLRRGHQPSHRDPTSEDGGPLFSIMPPSRERKRELERESVQKLKDEANKLNEAKAFGKSTERDATGGWAGDSLDDALDRIPLLLSVLPETPPQELYTNAILRLFYCSDRSIAEKLVSIADECAGSFLSRLNPTPGKGRTFAVGHAPSFAFAQPLRFLFPNAGRREGAAETEVSGFLCVADANPFTRLQRLLSGASGGSSKVGAALYLVHLARLFCMLAPMYAKLVGSTNHLAIFKREALQYHQGAGAGGGGGEEPSAKRQKTEGTNDGEAGSAPKSQPLQPKSTTQRLAIWLQTFFHSFFCPVDDVFPLNEKGFVTVREDERTQERRIVPEDEADPTGTRTLEASLSAVFGAAIRCMLPSRPFVSSYSFLLDPTAEQGNFHPVLGRRRRQELAFLNLCLAGSSHDAALAAEGLKNDYETKTIAGITAALSRTKMRQQQTKAVKGGGGSPAVANIHAFDSTYLHVPSVSVASGASASHDTNKRNKVQKQAKNSKEAASSSLPFSFEGNLRRAFIKERLRHHRQKNGDYDDDQDDDDEESSSASEEQAAPGAGGHRKKKIGGSSSSSSSSDGDDDQRPFSRASGKVRGATGRNASSEDSSNNDEDGDDDGSDAAGPSSDAAPVDPLTLARYNERRDRLAASRSATQAANNSAYASAVALLVRAVVVAFAHRKDILALALSDAVTQASVHLGGGALLSLEGPGATAGLGLTESPDDERKAIFPGGAAVHVPTESAGSSASSSSSSNSSASASAAAGASSAAGFGAKRSRAAFAAGGNKAGAGAGAAAAAGAAAVGTGGRKKVLTRGTVANIAESRSQRHAQRFAAIRDLLAHFGGNSLLDAMQRVVLRDKGAAAVEPAPNKNNGGKLQRTSPSSLVSLKDESERMKEEDKGEDLLANVAASEDLDLILLLRAGLENLGFWKMRPRTVLLLKDPRLQRARESSVEAAPAPAHLDDGGNGNGNGDGGKAAGAGSSAGGGAEEDDATTPQRGPSIRSAQPSSLAIAARLSPGLSPAVRSKVSALLFASPPLTGPAAASSSLLSRSRPAASSSAKGRGRKDGESEGSDSDDDDDNDDDDDGTKPLSSFLTPADSAASLTHYFLHLLTNPQAASFERLYKLQAYRTKLQAQAQAELLHEEVLRPVLRSLLAGLAQGAQGAQLDLLALPILRDPCEEVPVSKLEELMNKARGNKPPPKTQLRPLEPPVAHQPFDVDTRLVTGHGLCLTMRLGTNLRRVVLEQQLALLTGCLFRVDEIGRILWACKTRGEAFQVVARLFVLCLAGFQSLYRRGKFSPNAAAAAWPHLCAAKEQLARVDPLTAAAVPSTAFFSLNQDQGSSGSSAGSNSNNDAKGQHTTLYRDLCDYSSSGVLAIAAETLKTAREAAFPCSLIDASPQSLTAAVSSASALSSAAVSPASTSASVSPRSLAAEGFGAGAARGTGGVGVWATNLSALWYQAKLGGLKRDADKLLAVTSATSAAASASKGSNASAPSSFSSSDRLGVVRHTIGAIASCLQNVKKNASSSSSSSAANTLLKKNTGAAGGPGAALPVNHRIPLLSSISMEPGKAKSLLPASVKRLETDLCDLAHAFHSASAAHNNANSSSNSAAMAAGSALAGTASQAQGLGGKKKAQAKAATTATTTSDTASAAGSVLPSALSSSAPTPTAMSESAVGFPLSSATSADASFKPSLTSTSSSSSSSSSAPTAATIAATSAGGDGAESVIPLHFTPLFVLRKLQRIQIGASQFAGLERQPDILKRWAEAASITRNTVDKIGKASADLAACWAPPFGPLTADGFAATIAEDNTTSAKLSRISRQAHYSKVRAGIDVDFVYPSRTCGFPGHPGLYPQDDQRLVLDPIESHAARFLSRQGEEEPEAGPAAPASTLSSASSSSSLPSASSFRGDVMPPKEDYVTSLGLLMDLLQLKGPGVVCMEEEMIEGRASDDTTFDPAAGAPAFFASSGSSSSASTDQGETPLPVRRLIARIQRAKLASQGRSFSSLTAQLFASLTGLIEHLLPFLPSPLPSEPSAASSSSSSSSSSFSSSSEDTDAAVKAAASCVAAVMSHCRGGSHEILLTAAARGRGTETGTGSGRPSNPEPLLQAATSAIEACNANKKGGMALLQPLAPAVGSRDGGASGGSSGAERPLVDPSLLLASSGPSSSLPPAPPQHSPFASAYSMASLVPQVSLHHPAVASVFKRLAIVLQRCNATDAKHHHQQQQDPAARLSRAWAELDPMPHHPFHDLGDESPFISLEVPFLAPASSPLSSSSSSSSSSSPSSRPVLFTASLLWTTQGWLQFLSSSDLLPRPSASTSAANGSSLLIHRAFAAAVAGAAAETFSSSSSSSGEATAAAAAAATDNAGAKTEDEALASLKAAAEKKRRDPRLLLAACAFDPFGFAVEYTRVGPEQQQEGEASEREDDVCISVRAEGWVAKQRLPPPAQRVLEAAFPDPKPVKKKAAAAAPPTKKEAALPAATAVKVEKNTTDNVGAAAPAPGAAATSAAAVVPALAPKKAASASGAPKQAGKETGKLLADNAASALATAQAAATPVNKPAATASAAAAPAPAPVLSSADADRHFAAKVDFGAVPPPPAPAPPPAAPPAPASVPAARGSILAYFGASSTSRDNSGMGGSGAGAGAGAGARPVVGGAAVPRALAPAPLPAPLPAPPPAPAPAPVNTAAGPSGFAVIDLTDDNDSNSNSKSKSQSKKGSATAAAADVVNLLLDEEDDTGGRIRASGTMQRPAPTQSSSSSSSSSSSLSSSSSAAPRVLLSSAPYSATATFASLLSSSSSSSSSSASSTSSTSSSSSSSYVPPAPAAPPKPVPAPVPAPAPLLQQIQTSARPADAATATVFGPSSSSVFPTGGSNSRIGSSSSGNPAPPRPVAVPLVSQSSAAFGTAAPGGAISSSNFRSTSMTTTSTTNSNNTSSSNSSARAGVSSYSSPAVTGAGASTAQVSVSFVDPEEVNRGFAAPQQLPSPALRGLQAPRPLQAGSQQQQQRQQQHQLKPLPSRQSSSASGSSSSGSGSLIPMPASSSAPPRPVVPAAFVGGNGPGAGTGVAVAAHGSLARKVTGSSPGAGTSSSSSSTAVAAAPATNNGASLLFPGEAVAVRTGSGGSISRQNAATWIRNSSGGSSGSSGSQGNSGTGNSGAGAGGSGNMSSGGGGTGSSASGNNNSSAAGKSSGSSKDDNNDKPAGCGSQ